MGHMFLIARNCFSWYLFYPLQEAQKVDQFLQLVVQEVSQDLQAEVGQGHQQVVPRMHHLQEVQEVDQDLQQEVIGAEVVPRLAVKEVGLVPLLEVQGVDQLAVLGAGQGHRLGVQEVVLGQLQVEEVALVPGQVVQGVALEVGQDLELGVDQDLVPQLAVQEVGQGQGQHHPEEVGVGQGHQQRVVVEHHPIHHMGVGEVDQGLRPAVGAGQLLQQGQGVGLGPQPEVERDQRVKMRRRIVMMKKGNLFVFFSVFEL